MARSHVGEVLFFGIAWRASEAEGRAFMEEFDVPYQSGLDLKESIFREYGFTYQPATVFVTRAGQILRSHRGPLGRADLEAAVEELLDA